LTNTPATKSLSPTEASRLLALPFVDAPAQIGRYRVLGRLGSGGMGVVYAAYDPELGRKVAIKLIHDERGAAPQRRQELLLREAKAQARLIHPNIVAIHDVGVQDGQVYVAMEFVAGRTMRAWWREHQPEWHEVLAAMIQAGRGLVAAHEAGLVHRDIKPDNLLIGDDGRVRVADFGIARFDASALEPVAGLVDERGFTMLGDDSRVLGTPSYMSPEQHAGRQVGPHSDQFSFCVTLWEGLYGRRPFVGEAHELSAIMSAGRPARPAAASAPPAWLERAVLRGLAPRPEDRWPSMQTLLDHAAPDLRRSRQRVRMVASALTVVGLVLLVIGGRALQASLARREAERAAAQRLVTLDASMSKMLAEGQREDAEQALRAFVHEPALRDTSAAIDAWLLWADHMESIDELAAAQAAAAIAYTELPEGDPREPAVVLRIARQFRARWKFHELSALCEQAALRWPTLTASPEWVALRADAALARGDLDGLLAAVETGAAAHQYEAIAPVVRALATARCPVAGDMVARVTDWSGEAGPEVVLVPRDDIRREASLRRMDASLTPIGPDLKGVAFEANSLHYLPLVPVAGGPAYLVGHVTDPVKEVRLYELGDGPVRPVFSWRDDRPESSVAADLDGDGVRELYVGTATYSRRLYRIERDAQGQWQRQSAHPPTDAAGSDINGLVAGDFDGDGRTELAAAVGAWKAYDVRIFEAGADGELQLAVRQRFGHVRTMAAIRGADGTTLLALAKDDTAKNKTAWAPNEPQGEAAGLHIVRRQGDALVKLAYLPWPAPDGEEETQHALHLAVGDFDGDGIQDLAAQLGIYRPFARTLLVRQLADGNFVGVTLGAILAQVAGNFDDDPADELLVSINHGAASETCVLGVAGPPLAPHVAPIATAMVPTLADPILASVWRRAENLAGFGLFAEAAHALEDRVTLAADDADRRAVRRRAAELFEAAGDAEAAGLRFEALGTEGDAEATLRAVTNYERGLKMTDALRVAQTGLQLADPGAPGANELRAANDRLTELAQRSARIELQFDGPLAPPWQVHEPLALRVDPIDGGLLVEASADMAELATLPIELTGEPLTIEFELDVERAEWGSSLSVRIMPTDEGIGVAELQVKASGGGGYLRRHDTFGPPGWTFADINTDSPSERSEHRLRATLLPAHGRVILEESGSRPYSDAPEWQPSLVPGPYVLELRSTAYEDFGGRQLRARVRRIALVGARITQGSGPASVRERLAADLVAGRWHAAIAAGADEPGIVRLWRGTALAELGRVDDAITAFASVDLKDPEIHRSLRQLLQTPRRLAMFAMLLRAALGPRYPPLLLASLAASSDDSDSELTALRLAATADLEGLQFAASDRETRAELWAIRASARASVGALEAAERDLAAAAAVFEAWLSARGERQEPRLATIELRRAEIAARRGLVEAALAAAERAMTRATERERMAERLRLSPALAQLKIEVVCPSRGATDDDGGGRCVARVASEADAPPATR